MNAQLDDTSPLFFPCWACGAPIGERCKSFNRKTTAIHKARYRDWRIYYVSKQQGNTAQVEHSLKLRNER